jgi:Domain of unknown function (DUF222)
MDVSPRTSLALLDEFVGVDVHGMPDHELLETMATARGLASRAQAVELAAVAELVRRRFAEDAEDDRAAVEMLLPRDYVRDEIAEALTLSSASADELIRFATELTERLPGTFAALAAGEIDQAKARTLWRGTDQVDGELVRTIEAMVLARAPVQTTGEIRAKVRRLVRRLAPEALARRRREAEERRGVALVQTDDGTAHLTGVDLPADAATAAYGRVTAIATAFKRDGDDRGIEQLRADVFLALLRGTLVPPEPAAELLREPPAEPPTDRSVGEAPPVRVPGWNAVDDAVADVIARIARAELAALADGVRGQHCDVGLITSQAEEHMTSQVGGQITGSPPAFTAGLPQRHHDIEALIRQAGKRITGALADLRSRWCAQGTDTGSGPHSFPDREAGGQHGHPGYRPPAGMRRLIEHRDRRCCFPGCRRPVRNCDADHSVPFRHGGATCPCNLALLCRRHHRMKQTAGWQVEHIWPGVLLWIGPTGHWEDHGTRRPGVANTPTATNTPRQEHASGTNTPAA